MADAADEACEYEVGECLRFLWKHRLVPTGVDHLWVWEKWGDYPTTREFWFNMPTRASRSGCKAVGRVLEAWPKHKHLLIDALEKETVT